MRWYVVKPGIVRQSLERIRAATIHPHFNGYLCLKRASVQYGREDELPLAAKDFFDLFWLVPGAGRKPYLRPFIESAPTTDNIWFNKNPAGSYAPSSIRNKSFVRVVEVEGERNNARFTLRDRHWHLAFTHLCHDQRISVVDLSVILYRDYGIVSGDRGLLGLVNVFRAEFGLQNDDEFNYLYNVDEELASYQSVFEPIEESA